MSPGQKIREINIICKAKLQKYFDLTAEALVVAEKAFDKKKKREASAVWDMAQRYYEDAEFFSNKGDFVNAFAALNYAHGWLDCGSRLGLFRVKDSRLFVVK